MTLLSPIQVIHKQDGINEYFCLLHEEVSFTTLSSLLSELAHLTIFAVLKTISLFSRSFFSENSVLTYVVTLLAIET